MSGSLLVPEWVNGVQTFVPFAESVQKKLKEGDPTIGWEGDESLYIAPRPNTEGWMVCRMKPDGGSTLICVSKDPHILDDSLLIQLRDHDTRKVNVMERTEKRNAALHKANDDRAVERLSEGMERAVWGLKKDVGAHY